MLTGLSQINMDKSKAEAFIKEYRALCKKHGIVIGGFDDGPFLAKINQYNKLEELIRHMMKNKVWGS